MIGGWLDFIYKNTDNNIIRIQRDGGDPVDLRLLEYFLAVAKVGNITKAAQQLHVTQPTVSRQLADLEEMLGTPLLIRGKRQVTLTEAGTLFQQRAEEILTLMDKTCKDLLEQNDLAGGMVALGCVESCASRMLPEVLGDLSRLYPQIHYELYSADRFRAYIQENKAVL